MKNYNNVLLSLITQAAGWFVNPTASSIHALPRPAGAQFSTTPPRSYTRAPPPYSIVLGSRAMNLQTIGAMASLSDKSLSCSFST